MKERIQRNTSARGLVAGLLASAFALGLALPLSAEEVPVSYLVNRSSFKYVQSGHTLTFELHEDSACSAAVDSEDVVVGVPEFSVENVSPRTVKGVTPVDGKPIRLRYVMTTTDAEGRLYLRVTGANITAVGSDCQVQAASTPQPDTLEALACADGEVAKWDAVGSAWECAVDDDTLYALACSNVSQALAGAGSPFSATATCAEGSVLTGGGHSGLAVGDTLLSSQPDGVNGWFCEADGAAAAGNCEARCCSIE
jgi:hypothetical protein